MLFQSWIHVIVMRTNKNSVPNMAKRLLFICSLLFYFINPFIENDENSSFAKANTLKQQKFTIDTLADDLSVSDPVFF